MMTLRLTLILSMWWLTACLPAKPVHQLIATDEIAHDCGQWSVNSSDFTCVSVLDEGWLVQSNANQITLQNDLMSVVLFGTLIILPDIDAVRVLVLEGDAVISTQGRNRVLTAGRELVVRLDTPLVLSEISMADTLPDDLPLQALPRPLTLPQQTPTPRPSPIATQALSDDVQCVSPVSWTTRYTIVVGDTLAQIAQRYDLSVEELATANCLDNVERILVGQTLIVPEQIDASQGIPALNNPIQTGFRADNYQLLTGACTVLRWDASMMQEIYLDERPVNADSSQEICPSETTTYTLRVIYDDNQQFQSEIIITVQE